MSCLSAGPGPSARGMSFRRHEGASAGSSAAGTSASVTVLTRSTAVPPSDASVVIARPDRATATVANSFGVP